MPVDYYPKESIILEDTTIERDRVLPVNAFGNVTVRDGEAVNPKKVVARGELQQDFRIIDVADAMDIKDPAKLREILAVNIGDPVGAGQPLVNVTKRRDRKRAPLAPADGSVVMIEGGRVILQINPVPIEISARMPGTVIGLLGNRGVRIETHGTLIQCAWGNGKFAFSSFAFEPQEGLPSLVGRDNLLENVRGRVFILQRALTVADLEAAIKLRVDGLVAATMPHYLTETALLMRIPVILTEGFGERRISDRIYKLLRKYEKKQQAAFDAYTPNRWQNDRPEIIIPHSGAQSSGVHQKALRVNSQIRIKRAPYDGVFGQIVDLPESPQTIDNGLRTLVARVKLDSGDTVTVPLHNLELLGN